MKIGIIGPSADEIIPFIENINIKDKITLALLTFYSGSFEGIDIVALYCGACKVNAAIATQILIDKFNVTHVIVIGVAGGIEKSLKIGDTIISTKLAYHDVDDSILTEHHPCMKTNNFNADSELINVCKNTMMKNIFKQKIYFGKIVTGEAFISEEGRDVIKSKYAPLCVDMESASIAHVCYVNNIPFLAIRTITDTEENNGIEVFEENCISASLNSIELLKLLLKDLRIYKFNKCL